MEDTVTIITYNIHHGAGLDKKLDLQRIANVIKVENPDIVAFQEVDVKVARSNNLDEPKVLGELTDYKPFFGKSISLRNGQYGNAILVRNKDAKLIKHMALPGKEPRSMIAVESKSIQGTPYVFACTHLCLEERNCILSTELLKNWVRGLSVPAILVGDLNCTPDSTTYKTLSQTWTASWGNNPIPTFPAGNPRTTIDHCFTYPQNTWEVIENKVIDEPIASDHRPLKVILNLRSHTMTKINNVNVSNSSLQSNPEPPSIQNIKEDTIRVMTYNINHGAGADNKIDLQRIANIIKRENPDVVAFQEVDVNTTRSGKVDEPKIIGNLTGYKSFFGKTIPFKGGQYGNAILVKDQEAKLFKYLPIPGKEPRCVLAIEAKSTTKGNPFVFACTHFCFMEANAFQSTEVIKNWVQELSIPVVFMGDFNCTPDSTTFQTLTSTWTSTWGDQPLLTYPAKEPKSTVDHCFTYPREIWDVVENKVVEETLASDHRPLIVTLKFRPTN